jgi:hypothetical protein
VYHMRVESEYSKSTHGSDRSPKRSRTQRFKWVLKCRAYESVPQVASPRRDVFVSNVNYFFNYI